jgi:hypothetical protein
MTEVCGSVGTSPQNRSWGSHDLVWTRLERALRVLVRRI